MSNAESSRLENGVKSVAEITAGGVVAVLAYQAVAPELGALWGLVSGAVAGIITKQVTESAIR